jgi:His/Glu/Gln/Arg/opine family amino acid ABC transporter permease subunit
VVWLTWEDVAQFTPALLAGAAHTLRFTLLAFALALAGGLVIAMLRISGRQPFVGAAVALIEIVRGTPMIVQLYFLYFALPDLGVALSSFQAGVLGLAINYAVDCAEVYRGGIESVERGQVEAARSLGMSYAQTLRHVILPQAVRVAIPPLTNGFNGMLKDSSLVSTIAAVELTKVAMELSSATFRNFPIFMLSALIYLSLSYPLAHLARGLERRLGRAWR